MSSNIPSNIPSTKPEGGSWKKKLQNKWGEHSHCVVCGRAIPFDKTTCSQACQDKYKGAEKKKSRSNYTQIIFIVVIMVVVLLIPTLMGGSL
jgi:predicted nucleic acid-binding Zn ribbon protein